MGNLFIGETVPASLGALDRLYAGAELIWPPVPIGPTIPIFIDDGVSSSPGISLPPTAQVGDLAIFTDAVTTGGGVIPTEVIPPGWTKARSSTFAVASGFIACSSYKVLTASDFSSQIFGAVGDSYAKTILIYRTSSVVDSVVGQTSPGTTGTPTPISVATSSSLSISVGVKTVSGGLFDVFNPNPFDFVVINNAVVQIRSGVGSLIQQAPFTLNFNTADQGNAQLQYGFILGFQGVGPSPIIVSGNFPAMTVGTSIVPFSFTATGGTGPYTFNVASGAMPAGLTLAANGQVTGTPTTAGAFNVTVRATDSLAATGVLARTGSVAAAPVNVVVSGNFPAMSVGVAITPFSFTATGGTAPYTFSVFSGTMPAGLTLASNGQVTGTPTTAGAFNVTVRATDALSNTGNRPNSGTVTAAPAAVVYFGASDLGVLFDPLLFQVTVPAGATRMGVCFVGTGGNGDTSGQGAGAGGGTLVWFNADVTPGQTIGVTVNFTDISIDGFAVINRSQDGSNSTPGASGTAFVFGSVASSSITRGGAGGDTTTTGRAGGGGGAGGYLSSVTGGNGGIGVANSPGGIGPAGGSGGGGGSNGNIGGNGGSTHLYGQGTAGAIGSGALQGSAGGNGGNGSPSATPAFNTLLGGSGGGGRGAFRLGTAAFAIRFFAADYPALVEPVTAPIIVAPL